MDRISFSKRKTSRIDKNARLLIQALFQVKAEEAPEGTIGIPEEFRQDVVKAIDRIKGVPKSELISILGRLVGSVEPKKKNKIIRA